MCDPIDSSPPGSAVPGILQARTLEWPAISFSKKSHKNTLSLYLRLISSTETAHNHQTKEPQQTLGKRKFWLSRVITFVRFQCKVFNYKKSQATQRNRKVWPSQREKKLTETILKEDERQDHQTRLSLPWLGSNDALPLATRMETRLPWRPTKGSLTSPSYLVRNRTLGPPLENNPEIPPSSRDEGLRLLHGLATNLATSLQTPQEA